MDPKVQHSYWVESSSNSHLIDPKADDKYKLQMDKEKEKKADSFQPAKDILSSPKTLPSGWSFGRVESTGHPDAQESESAYVYFFPQGVSEEAVIQITNKNQTTWSLHINPLIGQPDIFQEAKVLKDFNQ
jgi:hypothetical protein